MGEGDVVYPEAKIEKVSKNLKGVVLRIEGGIAFTEEGQSEDLFVFVPDAMDKIKK